MVKPKRLELERSTNHPLGLEKYGKAALQLASGASGCRGDRDSAQEPSSHPIRSNYRATKHLDLFETLSFYPGAALHVHGMLVGTLLAEPIAVLSHWEFAKNSQINLPIAVLIWLMIYPMMLKVDFGASKCNPAAFGAVL